MAAAKEKRVPRNPKRTGAAPPAAEHIINARPVEVRQHDRILAGDKWVTVLTIGVIGDVDHETFSFTHAEGTYEVEAADAVKIEVRPDGSRFAKTANPGPQGIVDSTPAAPTQRRKRTSSPTPAGRTRRNVDTVEREAREAGLAEGMRIGEEMFAVRAAGLAQLQRMVNEALENEEGQENEALLRDLAQDAYDLAVATEKRVAEIRGGK